MSKGISAVIAVVLLLLVSVSVVFVFSTWVTGIAGKATEKTGEKIKSITQKLSSCVQITSVGWNKVYITNCGIDENEVIDKDHVNVFIDGLKVDFTADKDHIKPEETMELSLKGLWRFSLGEHKLEILIGKTGARASKLVEFKPHPSAVLVYSFDEGTVSGNVVRDLSGKANDGTIYGATLVNGKFGKALRFDGVDDYVEISNSANMRYNEQIVCVWVKPNYQGSGTYGNHNDIIRKGDEWSISTAGDFDSSRRISLQTRYIYGSSHWIPPSTPLNINDWNFICAIWNANTGKLITYINGNKEEFDIGNTGINWQDTGLLKISTGYAGPFNGIIDQVMIFSQALTPDEIYWMEG